MKKSQFSEEQITTALRQAESGVPVAEICRKLGISDAVLGGLHHRYWRDAA